MAEFGREKKICDRLVHKAELIRRRPFRKFYYGGYGMTAALGGVIIMPILIGIWCGGYLDEHFPQDFSWRLTLLFAGFAWGIFNAYHWLKIQEDKIERLEKEEEENER